MPGTTVVRKQTTLGGAAGIALLAFALIYRFFPGWIHVKPQPHVSAAASSRPGVIVPPIGVQPSPAVVAEEIGPPRELAGSRSSADIEPVEPETPPTANISALLKRADKAFAAGRLIEPTDDSALGLYRQVLSEDANNRRAKAGLLTVRDALLVGARDALDRGDADAAQSLVVAVSDLPHDKTELESLQERLKIARQVGPLLARAADLLSQGKVVTPEDSNALDVYRKVRTLDPDNALAQKGLEQIQRSYLDQALAAAAQDDFSGSDRLLAEAARVTPDSQGLLDTRTRVEGLRRQQAESVMAQARSALDAGNADLAEQLARRALAISADLPGIDEFNDRLRNARLYANFRPGQIVIDPFLDRSGTAPPLVIVPTGSFRMGSPDSENGHRLSEEPQREVEITVGFALGQTEVTVGQFREFVRASGYVTQAEKLGTSSAYDENTGRMSDVSGITWQEDYRGKRADDALPVVHLTWNDATTYISWLSARTGKKYRLPSETEFEYALRAGRAMRYPWGDGDPSKPIANVTGAGDRSSSHRTWSRAFPRYNDGFWGPAPVRSFPANAYGLFDIDGNVSEWVEDCWHDNYVRAPHDSRAWVNPGCERRVVRGGSWGSDPDQVRSAFRLSAMVETRSARVGFRVARDL